MKISKIAKILPIALAFTVCGAFAEHDPVAVNYELELKDFVQIEVDAAAKSSTTQFEEDYKSITLLDPISSTFTVYSNALARKLVLTGSCPSTGTAGTGKNGTAIKHIGDKAFQLTFTNSTHKPDVGSVVNINGTPAANSNPNAIAFGVSLVPARVDGPATATPIYATAWDETAGGIVYTVQNGKLTLAYTVDTTNVANTFNTQDMSGTYQATLTLTDLGPTSL